MKMMKIITNEYFVNFCDIIKRSLYDESNYEKCLRDLITASEDDSNHKMVYDDKNLNMQVIKLDEFTKDFDIKRRNENPELKSSHLPSAVDAICINKNNKWYFIEFKNQPLSNVVGSKSASKKMLSSLWLVFFLYSVLREKVVDQGDFAKFARENITYIVVVSSEKNEDLDETIGASWDENDSFYTPDQYRRYVGYYFRDVYVLTEIGLKYFVNKFE
jgi:hypothetical protein